MERQDHMLPEIQALAHILDLTGVDVRHRHGYRCRQIDDDRILRRRLPYVKHAVADVQRKFDLRPRKALGGILELEVAFRLLGALLEKFGAVDGDVDNFLFGLAEYLLPLRYGGRVVQMNHSLLRAF
ncbi:hypothetical protein D1872_287620 [compost metagenome]